MNWEIDHYNLDALENCDCPLCTEWREQKRLFKELREKTRGHYSRCVCKDCFSRRAAKERSHILEIKRAFYSEFSYISQEDLNRPAIMYEIIDLIQDSAISNAWWTSKATNMTLENIYSIINPLIISGA